MKHILINFALFVLRKFSYTSYMISPELRLLTASARRLVQYQDASAPDTSGERKRHQVYAALIKKYPGYAKTQIAMAIELAIQGVK